MLHNLASGRSCHDTGTSHWSHIEYAWVSDYTIPLDSILKKFHAVTDVVIVGAVRAMILAHSVGHILNDNGLYNFGWLRGNAVIIDAGCRPYAAVMPKREFNRLVMLTF